MLNFDEIRDELRGSLGYALTEAIQGTILLDAAGVNPYADLGYFVPVRLNNTPERVAVRFDPSVNQNILRDQMPVLVRRTADGFRLIGVDPAAASSLLGGSLIKVSAEQIGIFGGASASANGSSGLVPAPAAGQQNSVLRGNGQWSAATLSLALSGMGWYTATTTAGATTIAPTAAQTARRIVATATSNSVVDLRQIDTGYITNAGATEHNTWNVFATTTMHQLSGFTLTDDLELWYQLRSDVAATSDGLLLRFNADSTANNYMSLSSNTTHSNTLTTTENLTGGAQGIVIANGMCGANSVAGWYSFLKIKVSGYRVVGRYKVVSWEGFTPADNATGELIKTSGGGIWLNTANAINSYQMYTTSGSDFQGASQVIGIGSWT